MRQLPLIVCCLLMSALFCRVVKADDPPSEKPSTPPAEKVATPDPDKPATQKAQTHKVREEAFRIRVEQQGVFESSRMMAVAIKSHNTLTLTVERAVQHGKHVKKGQPLVWLDTAKIDEQIRSAEHSLKMSQLSLKESEAELELVESSLPLDRRATERAKKQADDDLRYFAEVTRPNSEKSAKFSLESSQHSLEYAREELDQLQKMYEADDLTEESEELVLKRAQRAVESAKYFLEFAQVRYDRTIEKDLPRQWVDLTETAKRQEFSLQKTKVTLPLSLKKQQLELEKLKQQHKKSSEDLAKLKRDRQALNVTAPMDGVVYYGRCTRGKWQDKSRLQEKLIPGGSLVAKQPFLTVVALRPLLVRVDLAEKELQHIRRGMAAVVKPTAFPDVELAAKVTLVSPIPIAPGVFDCLLRMEDKEVNARLVPGMNCKVEWRVYDADKAITVPKAAVFTEEDNAKKTFVYVLTPEGQHVKRPVVVGKHTAEKIEIRRGLKAGEEVLLTRPDESNKSNESNK
ncbi:MAG: HlyD family secretion protein [Pirellulaceae bacterium]